MQYTLSSKILWTYPKKKFFFVYLKVSNVIRTLKASLIKPPYYSDLKKLSQILATFNELDKNFVFNFFEAFNIQITFKNIDSFILLFLFQSETDEEIPIYIGHVPRYVSGINRTTTCNDIIRGNLRKNLHSSTSFSFNFPLTPTLMTPQLFF